MMKVLAISGSTRKGSYNTSMLIKACEGFVQQGGQYTLLNLNDFDIPLYNADLEESKGIPESVKAIKEIFKQHDAFMIASPEYNGSISPLLKNTLDWVSRKDKNESLLQSYKNKPVVIMSASPGALGGIRGLLHLRVLLSNLMTFVLPDQLALKKADTVIDYNGNFLDKDIEKKVKALGIKLYSFIIK